MAANAHKRNLCNRENESWFILQIWGCGTSHATSHRKLNMGFWAFWLPWLAKSCLINGKTKFCACFTLLHIMSGTSLLIGHVLNNGSSSSYWSLLSLCQMVTSLPDACPLKVLINDYHTMTWRQEGHMVSQQSPTLLFLAQLLNLTEMCNTTHDLYIVHVYTTGGFSPWSYIEPNSIFGFEGDLDDLLQDERRTTGCMSNFLHANGLL